MPIRKLGAAGPEVSALGLGCMGMSGAYGPAPRSESIATIHAALDAGIDLIDTGDFYGMGHNEMLIAEALAGRREQVKLSVKYGPQRGPTGAPMGFARALPPPRPRSPTASSASAPTTSTSTARLAWPRACRSRRPSARSPNSGVSGTAKTCCLSSMQRQ